MRIKEIKTNILLGIMILIIALVPLVTIHRFYYLDDSQRGALGQWYEIGRLILNGHLPILNVASQGAGNHIAEGQWGTFSPFVWLISIIIYKANNYLIAVTAIKLIALVVFGLGFRKFAQSFGVSDVWAFIAGSTVPFTGFITYADASTWVTDLFVAALVPIFWWVLRRYLYDGKLPIWPIVIGFTIISIGYVYGTIYVVVIMLGSLIVAIWDKDWHALRKIILLGIPLGLSTIAVYWPGMQISSVTSRTQEVRNDNFLAPSIGQLVPAFLPTYYPEMRSFFSMTNGVTYLPLMYISWSLLLLPMIDWYQAVKNHVSKPASNHRYFVLVFAMIITIVLLFGPSEMGPIRFMVRSMAYFGPLVILLTSLALTKFAPDYLLLNKRTLIQVIGVAAVASYMAWGETPERAAKIYFVTILLTIAVMAIAFGMSRINLKKNVQVIGLIIVGFVLTMSSAVVQHRTDNKVLIDAWYQVHPVTFPDYGMPNTKQEILSASKNFKGDVAVLGTPKNGSDTVIGNDLYISKTPSINVYTPVGFGAFSNDLRGVDATFIGTSQYEKLFSIDESTSKKLIDLLSIDTLQVYKDNDSRQLYKNVVKKHHAPTGWHLDTYDSDMFILQRDKMTGKAGGVVWSSAPVEQLKNSTYTVKVKVPASESKTKVVLSRMAWPGYSVSKNATIAKPHRGYLLTLSVDPSPKSKVVTVKFVAPGYDVSVLALKIAAAFVAIWAIYGLFILVKKH